MKAQALPGNESCQIEFEKFRGAFPPPMATVTVYIDDASIDDWSSMLASSFLSKSTIEIDDPS